MKCPVCDKNQIDPTDNPFMCPECFEFDPWEKIDWDGTVGVGGNIPYFYDEDDYGVD